MPELEHFGPLPAAGSELPVRRGRFIDVEIYGGLSVGADFWSANWDGAIPADLSSVDATATAGFYLDSSVGSAQFEGNIFLGGSLELDGGVVRTADDASNRLELSSTGLKAYKADDTLLGTIYLSTVDNALVTTAAYFQIDTGDNNHTFSDSYINLYPDAGTSDGINFTQLDYTSYIRNHETRLRRYTSDTSTVISSDEDYYASMNTDIVQDLWYPDADTGTKLYSDLNVFKSKVDGHYTIEPMVQSYGAAPVVDLFLNDSSYAGSTTIYGQALIENGSASSPSVAFDSDTDTGIYRVGANQLGISAGGSLSAVIQDGLLRGNTSTVGSLYILTTAAGSASAPTYSFEGDTDSGMYRISANEVGIAVGGALRTQVTNTVIAGPRTTTGEPVLRITAAGSESAPTYTFHNDTDTGIYLVGSDTFGITVGGTKEFHLSNSLVSIPNVYNDSAVLTANVNVDSSGRLRRNSSARKYKKYIKSAEWLADTPLRPVSFKPKKGFGTGLHYGFIANEIAEVLPDGAEYGDDGEVENYDTRAVIAVLAAKVNRLEQQVKQLQGTS